MHGKFYLFIIKMPKASKEYCLKTPIKRMGFTQRASCKAQGYIKRTSKQYKGKKIKSPKYRMNTPKRDPMNKSLYASGTKKPRTKTGYGDAEKAKMTLKNIKKFDRTYQTQVVNTLYNRAKYHKYQTKDMREAMKVFKKWLNENIIK